MNLQGALPESFVSRLLSLNHGCKQKQAHQGY